MNVPTEQSHLEAVIIEIVVTTISMAVILWAYNLKTRRAYIPSGISNFKGFGNGKF